MKLELLDTQTGEKKEIETDADVNWWAEGNGSCDCNRRMYFDGGGDSGVCLGCHRYLITNHSAVLRESDGQGGVRDAPTYSLRELNAGYPEELLKKHGIT